MDTRLQILFTYALSGDTRLAKKTIHEYHSSKLPNGMLQSRYPTSHPQVIPVFSLHWIFMLGDYYEQTGDKDFLRPYLGTVDGILCYFRDHKQEGLAAFLGYWETVDWAEAWNDNTGVPHACNYGASTIQNFQYSVALQEAAKLYALFGFEDMAKSFREEAVELNQTLLDRCYDGTLFREGPGLEEYSQHAQLWAVLAGAGDADLRKSLLQRVLSDDTLIPVSFPTAFYLMRALEAEDLYELSEPLWDAWKVLLDLGLTTIPETSFGHPRSDCHAWGSLLLYELPRMFLGVKAGEPGWASIVMEPRGFFIQHIDATVCVPGGSVSVKRTVTDSVLTVEVCVNSPQPMELRMPDGRVNRLTAGIPFITSMDLEPNGTV